MLGFNDSTELLHEYQAAYEENDNQLLKKLNEKFASTRVTLEVIIKERVYQKWFNFNGVDMLKVYYSVDIFGYDIQELASVPVLRTFQLLSPMERKSPFTKNSLIVG